MRNLPGYSIKDSEGTGTVRCATQLQNFYFFLINDDLYRYVSGTLTSAVSSFTASSTSLAFMAAGNDYVIATQYNDYVYYYSVGGASGSVDLSSFLGGNVGPVAYQDGYFIAVVNAPVTTTAPKYNAFYISALNDPTSWSALDFEDAEYKPDVIENIVSFHRNLFVFGNESYEVYENTGNPDFPFERIPGGVFDIGCASGRSVCVCGDELYFLSSVGDVRRIVGYDTEIVSSPALENIIDDATTSDVIGWYMAVENARFYVMSFPTSGFSYALNTKTGLWSKYMSGTDGATNHPAVFCIKNICGLNASGSVGLISDTYSYEQAGDGTKAAQYREVQTQVLDANRETMFMGSLEVWAKEAVGSTTVNPTLSVAWSDDMGTTWSTARSMPLGLSTGVGAQLRTHRLGSSKNRIFKFTSSNIYELQLYGGYIE
jgi:hypothetical protein